MSDQTKNSVKAGAYTALWTFIAIFGLSVIGYLNDVVEAASGDNATFLFGDPAVLVKAGVSAAAAAASGLVGTVVRLAQVALGRGDVPAYTNR